MSNEQKMREALERIRDLSNWTSITQARVIAREALAEQPAQGEAVAYWGAADDDGTLHMTMSADDANGGLAARQEVNDWINDAIADDGLFSGNALHLVALYTDPPAPSVPKRLAAWAKHDSGNSITDIQIGYESARRDVAAMLASAPPAPSVPSAIEIDALMNAVREHGSRWTNVEILAKFPAMLAAAPARKS